MGMLFRPLDAVLGSQSKVGLLRALLQSSAPVSAREAARLAGLAHSGALRALDDLVELGVVNRTETPGQHLYTINSESELVEQGLGPLFTAERGRVAEVFRWIPERLKSYLSDGVVRSAVIFGSAARGEDRPDSDFDLLVVAWRQEDVEPVHQHLVDASGELFQRFGLLLSPVVIAVEQLVRQHHGGDPFVEAVLQEGRHVAGVRLERLLELQTVREGQG
jgi:predicted nucleotidyltransferase